MTAARAVPAPPASHTRAAADPFNGLRAMPVVRRPRHEVLAELDAAIARKAAALSAARTLERDAAHGLGAVAWGNVRRDLERDLGELRAGRAAMVGP